MLHRLTNTLVPALLLCGFASIVHPQAAIAEEEKAAFSKSSAKDGGIGMPSPYDKFLALEEVLSKVSVDWGKEARTVAKSVDSEKFKDLEVGVPLALGVRVADGVMTVKAKDAEQLNKCAADIEKLAKKLGVTQAELGRAREVRTAANKGEWLKVFMELAFFQQDIMRKVADEKNPARGILMISAAWLQGARYVANVVDQNFSPTTSNILREPVLVKNLAERIQSLPDSVKGAPKVKSLSQALSKIAALVDIPQDGSISKENVEKIKTLCSETVDEILSTK